jgi:hypothetical protein
VEVARQGDEITVRNSADPPGAMLEFRHVAWRRWISDVKNGLFKETPQP